MSETDDSDIEKIHERSFGEYIFLPFKGFSNLKRNKAAKAQSSDSDTFFGEYVIELLLFTS